MNDSVLNEAEVAQTERIGLGDLVLAGVIAALTFVFATLWEYPGLHPSLWNGVAVATGIRPTDLVAPGYWTAVATFVYDFFGLSAGASVLKLLGHLFLAGIAVAVYAVLREWLAFAMRARPQLSKRRTLVMRMAAGLGAAAFVASDPVWTAGQCLSETTIIIALTLAAVEFFFVFLRKGTLKYAYLCAMCVGLMTAETPMGFFLTLALILVNHCVLTYMPAMESPFFDPAVMEVGKWHMTFIYVAAVIVGVALNSWTFLSHGGTIALGCSAGDIPIRYLLDYWHVLASAASVGAWILWLGVCLLPFVVATIKFPASADEEQFLSYASGIIFCCCGLLVLCQSSFLPALWFWTYFPMNSQVLLSVGLFCCAATLALSVTIFGVDALCRNHARLANQVFGLIPMQGEDEDEEDDEAPQATKLRRSGDDFEESKVSLFFRRALILVLPIVMLGLMAPGRVKAVTRTMLAIIDTAIQEIVTESGDATYLFSDGNLDAAVEIEAAKRGLPLRCYSLMGGARPIDLYLRLRNITGEEDNFSFKFDTAMGLRSWIREKPERLAVSAAMMGFDLWKRDGKPIPPMGGLVSRPMGFASEDERQRGVKMARALAEAILELHRATGGLKGCTDEAIRRAFDTIQWRLARMCIYRGEAEDFRGEADAAIYDANLAKQLNDCNAIYRDLVRAMEKRNQTMLSKLTPREGLQLALVRADFVMGKLYAETILGSDPENPDANFAMGMYYLQEHQLTRAERYLLRCLIRKPDEPAIYNNLAMLQISLKKFDAARKNIEKALKLIPESAAVLDTKKALDAAVDATKSK